MRFKTAGNLTISAASFGCAGWIANGDPMDFVANDPFMIGGPAVPTYLS